MSEEVPDDPPRGHGLRAALVGALIGLVGTVLVGETCAERNGAGGRAAPSLSGDRPADR